MLTSVLPARSRVAEADVLPQPASDDDWLPTIPAADAALLNALYRHRPPIEATIAGHKVIIETTTQVPDDLGACAFRLTLSGRRALLRTSADLIDLCAQSLAVASFDRLGNEQAGMLVEFALLHPIKMIEARLRKEVRIEERVAALEDQATFLALRFRVRGLPNGDGAIELFVDRQNAAAIATALDEFAIASDCAEELPIPVRICAASTDFTLAELRTLRPGDVILPNGEATQPPTIVAVVGEHTQFQTERVATGFRVVSRRAGPATGVCFMQQPTEALQRPSADEAGLEQLPIRVVFELGRLELPLGEVRRLAPGYVLPLAKPSEAAVDIVANGRKIGHGSLMKIGDSIGVRVERLFSDE